MQLSRAPTSAEMRAIALSMMDRGVEGGYVTMTSLSGAWAFCAPWTPAAATRAREVRKETIFMLEVAEYVFCFRWDGINMWFSELQNDEMTDGSPKIMDAMTLTKSVSTLRNVWYWTNSKWQQYLIQARF